MQQEDDLRGLAKTIDFLRAISILFALLHVYWFCYEVFKQNGFTIEVIDKILSNFNKTTGLFNNILYTKLFSFLFLGLSCLGTKGVKSEKLTLNHIKNCLLSGFLLFFLNWWILYVPLPIVVNAFLYVTTLTIGFVLLLHGGVSLTRLLKNKLLDDPFNENNESFMQETVLKGNEYSVNLPTKFRYRGKEYNGWINIVNPFRASAILGSPGSGKSFAIVNNFIRQHLRKGFSMYLYDFKFPDLSEIAYNYLYHNSSGYKTLPKFYVINFDDPRKSHRCNPLAPQFMEDISDAYEAAYVIMLNLNKSWIQKQGDFFVESPIILLAAIIWFLKIYQHGRYCTFPHTIELLNRKYEDIFTIMTSYPELENYLSPFMDAWMSGASDQLVGQIASAKIPLSRLISPRLYWTMTGNDFSLDINNPKEPKVVTIGNNPDRQNIYSCALGLYNSRIIKLINKKNRLKCSVIIDELPTIYFRGLDQLIATARSNKVSVCLAYQDESQLARDYGDKEAKVITNIIGNILSGQVVGETAKNLSERFGKIVQERESISNSSHDKTNSTNTQLDYLIPPGKISTLSQGHFVGAIADNFSEKIKQKVFNAEIVVNEKELELEYADFKKIPTIYTFKDKNGNDVMSEIIQENYEQIKKDVIQIVEDEMERIKADPKLAHLIKNKEEQD